MSRKRQFIKMKQQEDLSGIFITKGGVPEEYVFSPYYKEIAFCVWGHHHINGKKPKGKTKKEIADEIEKEQPMSSITQHCKGSDVVVNMHDTKLGKVCVYCFKDMPKKYLKEITIKA